MKFLRIVFILLFLIMSMGLVSAQDNLTDTIQTDISPTDEIGSFEELENDITNANGTLEITKDYINDDYLEGIEIARDNLVINGNNHTIDGNGQSIFSITGSNITINNLVFVNAYYDDKGGAIRNTGTIALNNVTFINNGADIAGGAIFNMGTMDLHDAVFINNSAGACAGAIYTKFIMGFYDSLFINNSAGDFGGAVVVFGDASSSGCVFINNGAAESGGALYVYTLSNLDLNNASFVNNGVDAFGGAICVEGMAALNNVSFVDNSAENSGGAIYVFVDGVVGLNNVSFVDNNAEESGGAFSNDGMADLNNVSFVDNGAGKVGGAFYNKGTADLNNASFVNNSARKYGGVFYNEEMVALNNASFVDNCAEDSGAAIYAINSELDICNSLITSKESIRYGQIFSKDSIITIDNLTVVNVTSNYSSAILAESSDVLIVNSRFVNLTANVSAGAISTKGGGDLYIRNCEFINTCSSKNAGALNIDIIGDDEYVGNVIILDTLFEDTSSGFGGAFIQLGGNLLLNNSFFIKNSATFDGGAVYLSHTDAVIDGCTFDSDSIGVFEDYPTYGGAIYFDYGNLTLNNSRFVNTSSYSGSGTICTYDSLYEIANSTFDGGEAVHAIFKRDGSQVVNCSGNFTISDENVFYHWVIVGEGMNLTPVADELDFDSLPARFDLRDYNWTSPAKDQGLMGVCWVFATVSALESALLKSCGLSTDLSENNMADTMFIYSKYGIYRFEGGIASEAIAYCLNWFGTVSEDEDAYDEVGKISPTIIGPGNIHVQDVVFNPRDCEIVNGDPSFKQAILKYGGLSCNVYGFEIEGASNEFYNDETHAQYAYNISSNHVVCVVGWDDDYPKENFIATPPGDGAWICKNSWGTDFGDDGCYYVSYYDTTFATYRLDGFGFLFENTIPYNKNYRYDLDGIWEMLRSDDGNPITYLNEFEACGDDLIAAVGTYFDSQGVEYKVEIKVNGELVYTQEGVSPYFGYHTIKLDKYIPIKKGDNFSAAVTSNAMPYCYIKWNRPHYPSGLSYKFENGSLVDLYDKGMMACLKVYTVADDSRIVDNEDILVDYGKKSWFSVRVVTADGYAVVGGDVDFTINGKTITVKTDINGTAKLEISENPGVYVITATYNNQTCQNKVIVKSKSPDERKDGGVASNPIAYGKTVRSSFQPVTKEDVVIVAKNVVVSQKEFSKGYSYKIILKSKTGKLLANKKVIIIFNGMIFIGFTDENGTVFFNLTGNMTGLFNITIIFEGDDYYSPIAENRTVRIE